MRLCFDALEFNFCKLSFFGGRGGGVRREWNNFGKQNLRDRIRQKRHPRQNVIKRMYGKTEKHIFVENYQRKKFDAEIILPLPFLPHPPPPSPHKLKWTVPEAYGFGPSHLQIVVVVYLISKPNKQVDFLEAEVWNLECSTRKGVAD